MAKNKAKHLPNIQRREPIKFRLIKISLIDHSYGEEKHISLVDSYKAEDKLRGIISPQLHLDGDVFSIIVNFRLTGDGNKLFSMSVSSEFHIEKIGDYIEHTPDKTFPVDLRTYLIYLSINHARGVQGITITRPELSMWFLPLITEQDVAKFEVKELDKK